MRLVETKFDPIASTFRVDSGVNEKFLLHGTKPETLLAILQNGLHERFSGGTLGSGLYLAEDAAKADQYCTVDSGWCEDLRELHKRLYIEHRLEHPG